MANENVANMKSLNTRIKLKYDSYSNWTSKNPTLLEGEVAIATIPAGTNVPTSDSTTMQHLPNVVIKVGDGKTEYNLLPFLSALAADVYAWAKAPEKPVYKATEIEGLDNFIAGEIQDTDTQYTIQSVEGETYKFQLMKKNKGDADAAFTHVCYIDLTEVDSRLDALEQKMGEKSVADQIDEVIAGLDLEKLESAEGSGKVLSYIQQVDGQVEAEMRSLVEADIPALSIAKTTGLQDALNAKQNNLIFTDDYTADTSVVATKKYVDDTAAAAINLNNNDAAVEHQFVTEAKQENGEVKVTRRALVKEDIPAIDMTQVTDLDKEFAKKQDNLEFMTAYDAASNKVATQAEIKAVNDAIGGMDLAKKEATAGKIISFIEQADGVVTADVRDLTAADFKDDLIPEAAVNGLTERIDAKQDILVWADGYAYNAETNKAATVDYVANAVAGLNGAMHFIGKVEGDTFEAAVAGLTPNGGDVVLYGYDEYVYDAANKAWMPLGNESIYQTKEQAAADHKAIDDAIALKQDILGFEGTYNKETNKVVTKSAMDTAIANAIYIDVSSKEEAGKVVLGVAQQDGRIEVTHGALTSAHFADDVVPEAAVAGLTEALASKQNNLSFMTEPSAENKVATKTEIDALSKTISDMDLAQVDATQGHILTGLKQEDGVVTATTRALVKEDIPVIEQAQVNGLDKTLADADAAAQGYANTAEANAKNFATEEIGKAIAAIDISVAAEEGKFVTGFTVEDGALKASTTSAVDAKYLTQTTGDYLVFDCGTASTVY